MGSGPDLPLPVPAKIPNLGPKLGGPAMRAILCLAFFLLALTQVPPAGARTLPEQTSEQTSDQKSEQNDPFAWLEDVHGARPLEWVAAQNSRSLGLLKADPRYQANYDTALALLDADDRIPYGRPRHGHVYNFWQDAANPKGVWRRTAIADYASAQPRWEVLLDVDALNDRAGKCVVDRARAFVFDPRLQYDFADLIVNVMGWHP